MQASISIICQPDALRKGAELAQLAAQFDVPIVTNFPCNTDTTVSNSAATVVSDQTALVVLLISPAWFDFRSRKAGADLEPGTIQRLFSISKGVQSTRIFPILVDEDLAELVSGTWLGELQWYVDSAETRNRLMSVLEHADDILEKTTLEMAFKGLPTVLSAVEPASTIELIQEVRIRDDRIAYDIYTATHKFHQTKTKYVHLYRGVPVAKTASHVKEHGLLDDSADSTFFYLSHERGQSRLDERIENLKRQLGSNNVRYIEDVVSQLVSLASLPSVGTSTVASDHYYIEPQIRRSILTEESSGSDFTRLISWLESPDSGVIVLEGQGGIGKTWTMQELHRRVILGEINFSRRLDRRAIFISSTEINRAGSTLNDVSGNIDLYDLYYASISRKEPEHRGEILTRETFFSAISIGNILIFVDGLDEVIARHRSRFTPEDFFGDIQNRVGELSNTKIFISCRTLFFDQYEYVSRFPIIQPYELLAFDQKLRDRYFQDSLGRLENQIIHAKELSDNLALVPNTTRYVPFVLSLIVDILIEKADQKPAGDFKIFNSGKLDPNDYSDRIIGQFCNREILKIGDPLRSLNVDQQVKIFERLAVADESTNGKPNAPLIADLIKSVTQLRTVSDITDTFLSHPFLKVTNIGEESLVDLRFDFMREHFLTLYLAEKVTNEEELTLADIKVFIKYCSDRSAMSDGLAKRLDVGDDEFGLFLIGFHGAGEKLLSQFCDEDEMNVLRPGSPASEFSYSLISLMTSQLRLSHRLEAASFTAAITNIFATEGVVSRLALIDTTHSDGTRTRLDFRGLSFSECLFHSIDIWSCNFDDRSYFSRCRFINCDGIRSRDSGITEKTFDPNCIFDDVFESVFSAGQNRVDENQSRIKADIQAFAGIFFSSGVFEDLTEDYVPKHYTRSNPSVSTKKMLRVFRKHGVVVLNPRKKDKAWYMISPECHEEVIRLISQNTFSGKIKEIAADLVG